MGPIMSCYIINNHIYPNNYNTQQNPKLIIHKKKEKINIANFNNLNININTNITDKPHISKNNSNRSSYNPIITNKIPPKQKLNLNQEELNFAKNSKRYKKKLKIDSNLLMKEI